MKLIAVIAFMFLSHGLFAQNKKETIIIKTFTSCNHCKVCETCGGKMEKDLYFVRGIKYVNYNEDDMTITVKYKPKAITPDEIRKEISKLGFAADNVPADPKGVETLDSCCRGK